MQTVEVRPPHSCSTLHGGQATGGGEGGDVGGGAGGADGGGGDGGDGGGGASCTRMHELRMPNDSSNGAVSRLVSTRTTTDGSLCATVTSMDTSSSFFQLLLGVLQFRSKR